MKATKITSAMSSYTDALLKGDAQQIQNIIKKQIDRGDLPKSILEDGLIRSMSIVGEKFKNNEIYIPEMMVSAIAMKAGLDTLRPYLSSRKQGAGVRVLLATVKDDLHDVGKNLVKIIFEGAGFEVVDLGTDVSEKNILTAVKTNKPDVVGLSALLTTTMLNMKAVVETIEEAGLRKDVKVIIGGAPVTNDYANEIGADAYAPDAYTGVEIVNDLLAVA